MVRGTLWVCFVQTISFDDVTSIENKKIYTIRLTPAIETDKRFEVRSVIA